MQLMDRLQTLSLLVIPYVALASIIRYCQKNNQRFGLNDELEITPLQRKALTVHFLYFVGVPIAIEAFPDAPGLDVLVGPEPSPSNVLFMVSCLAAENFFVTSTSLAMILLREDSVPRWALMTPFAQLLWNLKNHVSWFFLGSTFAPQGPLLFALLDMVIIWPIVAIYGHHFVTAKVEKKD